MGAHLDTTANRQRLSQQCGAGKPREPAAGVGCATWHRRPAAVLGGNLRNEALAAEWQVLRETCCKYRFGRAELLPIKKTGETVSVGFPASFGLSAVGCAKADEQVAATPLSPEIVAAGEERAREMRLYAARLEVLDGRNLGRWE